MYHHIFIKKFNGEKHLNCRSNILSNTKMIRVWSGIQVAGEGEVWKRGVGGGAVQ